MLNKRLSVFCGNTKVFSSVSGLIFSRQLSGCSTGGKSSPGIVCKLKRLRPQTICNLPSSRVISTIPPEGKARNTSKNLRADTVTKADSSPTPISAVVLISTSKSVAVKSTRLPSFLIKILAKIGIVLLRSTIPMTVFNGFIKTSLLAFSNCMIFPLNYPFSDCSNTRKR